MARAKAVSPEVEAEIEALARRRARVGLGLTAAVVLVYFGFIFAVAYAREALGVVIVSGWSVGIVFGAMVIVASWLLTWVYVRWANGPYDAALHRLRG